MSLHRAQSHTSSGNRPAKKAGNESREETAGGTPRKKTMAHQQTSGTTQPPKTHKSSSKTIAPPTADASALESMRKRMTEALAKKQQQPQPAVGRMSPVQMKNKISMLGSESYTYPSAQDSHHSTGVDVATASTDSTKTVKAGDLETAGPLRTPSYPFPRMQLRLHRGISQRSGPHHKPFTLLSPTNEPVQMLGNDDTPQAQPSSELSTPLGNDPLSQVIPDDPNYPTPDLYDMVLMLSTEPGLESWWTNVTEILAEAYGAERASLALPGDTTDLENVPWGQRATFNIYGTHSGGSVTLESNATSDFDVRSVNRGVDFASDSNETSTVAKRPPLESRHSIAGIMPDKSQKTVIRRPEGPARAVSYLASVDEKVNTPARPRLTRQSPTPQSIPTLEAIPDQNKPYEEPSIMWSMAARCHVHRALQPLEMEPDPLLVRTGVANLFGKRHPIVLTRAYSEEHVIAEHGKIQPELTDLSPQAKAHLTELPHVPPFPHRYGSKSVRAFDEFEQPEPSPWSQSPSPSPAARPDPDESPFFSHTTPTATVDEAAFEQNPPIHDYGATANQPINAIGTDMSKTLVHIPLIQPVPSRSIIASGLRFPVAILSFFSPINPYPRNLRHSLSSLLPHLASTFSIAQQFTNMQERLKGGSLRRSPAFGLGGTFSDEGSELELVSELSSQINLEKDKHRGSSLRDSLYSPSEGTAASRESFTASLVGTPIFDQLGMSSGHIGTPGRFGSEIVDSYFSAKRNRSTQQVQTPEKLMKDDPSEGSKKQEKLPRSKGSSRKSAGIGKASTESASPTMTHPASGYVLNDASDHAHSPQLEQTDSAFSRSLHRDSIVKIENEKPLPELISALMLNAVPLQLFLAKPTTGDLVWTNRKFDAFRSQGEGRVRDPWKNVHDADRDSLVKSWTEALNSGSQFTHYVRVRRFNSDSDFRWFVFRASTLLSSGGRLLYWVGSFLDVHEQYIRNLETSEKEASMARDAKIRALADAIPQILFEAIEGEGIVSVNQQWHTFSGQNLEEARGLGFARQVHHEDLYKCGVLSSRESRSQNVKGASDSSSSGSSGKTAQQSQPQSSPRSMFTPDDHSLNKMLKEGALTAETDENGRTSYSTEIRLRSKGGEFRWHLIRLVKIQHELLNSGRASWYGTCTDIETRMGLERELNQANKKVHQEMESKTKFFANMSHEIRTPLNGILGSMPWLVESLLDHEQRRTVDTIQNSANNLRELVDNILDVTKVEAGKMTLVPKWFHVRSLCEEVVDTVSSRAIERGLELNYSLGAEVPTTVKGDPFRVRQVLLNLMANSVKFTEQGEIYLRCYLKAEERSTEDTSAAMLAFDVVDTGRGFNEIEFQRLFKQFGQIEGASQHEPGSGLGLFLSKQLVEMHGGELSVKSKTGEGSTFSFYVRVEKSRPSSDTTSPATTERPRNRASVSFGADTRPRSIAQTPGLYKHSSRSDTQSPTSTSPIRISPPLTSPGGSAISVKSSSGNVVFGSSISSLVPTPESAPGQSKLILSTTERKSAVESRAGSTPMFRRSQSDNDGRALTPDLAHPDMYSVVIICPAENARHAVKQHIEHVVPHQIPAHVTTLGDIGALLDLMTGPTSATFTHIVLDVPASSDVMLFMRHMQSFTASSVPTLVVITDYYQKRDVQEDFAALISSGRKAYLVQKPVKPSVFAMIFDPAQLRKLSKDRAREVAQSSSDDFKKIANQVKESIGNKSFRILLVEDSDVNRMVILRYMRRVGLESEEARDGQECVDKVTTRPHGYYSLIICDIQMPRKNGYDTCREIRQWEKSSRSGSVPIMALTANAMPEERAAAASAGFSDYLTKPVDFNRLGIMMMTLLDSTTPRELLRGRPLDDESLTRVT